MPDADPKLQSQRAASLPKGATQETPAPENQATVAPQSSSSSIRGAAEVPEMFGRYRIVRLLGQGGMGAVYLAHDTQLDRQVALKVPKFDASDGPQVLERFFREARSAATLHHPNICPIFDVGVIDGKHYLTMAFIEGKPLTEFIPEGKGVVGVQAAALVRKLALALDEAHRRGIVHRDLKPANIMINQRKEPVIMDFGLARQTSKQEVRLTKSGAIVGTPAYMSPEQVSGKEVGAPGDIFSLGVILYELLTGKLPFDGPMMAVLSQILLDNPEQPTKHRPDLDPNLEAICLKMMAKDPKDRYASMAELAAALGHFLTGAGRTAAPIAPATANVTASVTAEAKRARATKPAIPAKVGEFEEIDVEDVVSSRPGKKKRRKKISAQPLYRRPWLWIGGVAVVIVGMTIWLLAGVVFQVRTKSGIVVLNINEPGAQVFVDEELKITLTSPSDKEPIKIEVAEGKHVMKVVKGGFVTETREFTLRAGTPQEIRVTLRPEAATGIEKQKDPALKETPPSGDGWISLFNGKDLTGWVKENGQAPEWKVENGYMEVRNGSIMTQDAFPLDFELHVEFWLPKLQGKTGQGKANSGIYLNGRHEIQILDMVDNSSVKPINGCGALFGVIAPKPGGIGPPETWQTFDIKYQSPRGTEQNVLPGRLTVVHNGVTVIDDTPFSTIKSAGALNRNLGAPGPIMLQDHGSPVRFRNLKLRPLPPGQTTQPSPPPKTSDNTPPPGFVALFNGKDLTGWQGLVALPAQKKMSPAELAQVQAKANQNILPHWTVKDSMLTYDGKGNNLQTVKHYGDFELYVDWKIGKKGDSGIYLRGNPQVQIWDNPEGSGGLYNNQINPRKPLVFADRPLAEWNTFHIIMRGDRATIRLNGQLVVDNTPLENYWEKGNPLPPRGPIELQHHGDQLWFKNIYIKELP